MSKFYEEVCLLGRVYLYLTDLCARVGFKQCFWRIDCLVLSHERHGAQRKHKSLRDMQAFGFGHAFGVPLERADSFRCDHFVYRAILCRP